MARQDLAYSITVNDAQLRLATQHVAAFNAELAASTVTGRKLDESMRSLGRRSVQVGNFFTRNLTLPITLAGAAAAKYSYDFQKAAAKVQGLAGTTASDLAKMNKEVFRLASTEATLGPVQLETALFHLRSAGLSVAGSIKALKPVSEAAVSGLGSLENVTTAVTSAMDSYGFKNLSAAHATDVLIETVRKGNIPVQELAGSIGRVTSIAAAMKIHFSDVGAAIASITRQMPNANLAVTGLRAILQTFLKDQPQTARALAAVGVSGAGIRKSLQGSGLFPTLLGLREQFKGIHVDQKTLVKAYEEGGKSAANFRQQLDSQNSALAKIFPNIRALAAFLIITGSNAKLNANVFAELDATTQHVGVALKRTFGAFSKTDAGRFRLALGQIQVDALKVGPTFLKAGASILEFANNVFHLFDKLGPVKGLLKGLGVGLLLFGPIVSLFGRLTQVASGGVTAWGRWQAAATEAGYAANGVNIATDKAMIATAKATTPMVAAWDSVTSSITGATSAVNRFATTTAASTGAGIRGGILGATGGNAFLSNVSRGSKLSRGGAVGRTLLPNQVDALTIATISARRQALLAASQAEAEKASAAVAAAQQKVVVAGAAGGSGVTLASEELRRAQAVEAVALARVKENEALAQTIFADEKLTVLTRELQGAQTLQLDLASKGARISAANQAAVVAGLEEEIAVRQKLLARNIVNPASGFAAVDQRAKGLQAANVAAQAATAAAAVKYGRITATSWGTAIEGMKSASKLAFPLIALTFATDVVGKIIFDSHHMKQEVEKDWLSMAALIGGSLAFFGSAAKAKIATPGGTEETKVGIAALGVGLTQLKGKFAAAAEAGFSFKTKLALVAAGLLGGQVAGVHLSQSISTLGTYMLVKGVLGFTKFGQANVGLYGKLALTRAGIIGISVALTDLITNGIPGTKKLFGELDKFFSKHIDPHLPFIGNWLSKRDAHDAAERLGTLSAQAQKTKDALSGLTEFQKQQLEPIPKKFRADVVLAFKQDPSGQTAEELINQIEFRMAQDNAVKIFKKLKAEGHNASAAIVQNFINGAKETKKAYDHLFDNIGQSIDNAFSAHTQRMLDSFDQQTQTVLDKFDAQTQSLDDAFDARTQKLQDALKVKVKVPKLNETFTVTVNGKTPAERQLDALDKLDQRRTFQRDLFDSRQQLSQDFLIGDPNAIRADERKLQDAQSEQRRYGLQQRATIERAAADKQTKVATEALDATRKKERQALDDSRKYQRQAISNNRDTMRRNIEATRTIMQQNLDALIAHEKDLYDSGKVSLNKYHDDILGIMRKFGVSAGQAGHDGGLAYESQMNMYFKQLTTDIERETKKQAAAVDKLGTRIKNTAQGIAANFAEAHLQENFLKAKAAAVTPGNANAAAISKIAQGLPTRQGIIDALKLLQGPLAGQYIGDLDSVTKAGRPSKAQYTKFLNLIPAVLRSHLRTELRNEGFFGANTGAVVPGFGSRDTVPAMLTPGEIVLNRRQQRNFGRMIGKPDASPHELFEEVHRPQRFASGGVVKPLYVLPGARGLRRPGNIDLNHRKVVRNPDGSFSTEESTSFSVDGNEVLLPTVYQGAHHAARAAFQYFRRTGQNLGWFDSIPDANAYADRLHERQSRYYGAQRYTPGEGRLEAGHPFKGSRERSTPWYPGQKPSFYRRVVVPGNGHDRWAKWKRVPVYVAERGPAGDDVTQWNAADAAWADSEKVKSQGLLGTVLRGAIESVVPAQSLRALAAGRNVSVSNIISDLITAASTDLGASAIAGGFKGSAAALSGVMAARRSARLLRAVETTKVEGAAAVRRYIEGARTAPRDMREMFTAAIFPGDEGSVAEDIRRASAWVKKHPRVAAARRLARDDRGSFALHSGIGLLEPGKRMDVLREVRAAQWKPGGRQLAEETLINLVTGRTYVARDRSGNLAGIANLALRDAKRGQVSGKGASSAELISLATTANSKGYGRSLVDRVLRDALKSGAGKLELLSSTGGESFYEHLGFSRVGGGKSGRFELDLKGRAGRLRSALRTLADERGEVDVGAVRRSVTGDKPYFHGTTAAFRRFSKRLSKEYGLYGPGIYFTDNKEVASGYALSPNNYDKELHFYSDDPFQLKVHAAEWLRENPQYVRVAYDGPFPSNRMGGTKTSTLRVVDISKKRPQVKMARLNVKHPFDVEKKTSVSLQEVLDAARGIYGKDFGRLKGELDFRKWPISNNLLYKALSRTSESSPHTKAHRVLRALGYDAIRYPGGRIMGGAEHEVMVLIESARQVRSPFNKAVRRLFGGIIPGAGSRDTVPAMLTPGEIVLNRQQQHHLGGMIGMPGASPSALFDAVAKRFAGGGVVQHFGGGGVPEPISEHGQGQLSPLLPVIKGFKDVSKGLKDLVTALGRSAVVQQNLPEDPRTTQLIEGGIYKTIGYRKNAKGKRVPIKKFMPFDSAKLAKLRKALDPVHVESLVNNDPALAGLSPDAKRNIEAQASRLQAHSVRSGLITVTPNGAFLGGSTRRLSTPQAAAASPDGQQVVINGGVTITVQGSGNPEHDGRKAAQAFRRELQGHARGVPMQESGRFAGDRIGLR